MRRQHWSVLVILGALAVASPRAGSAQADTAGGTGWRDRSPHRAGHLRTGEARLHYLDWGGSGPLLLLVHGWGSNAHVFDDLAPLLTDRYHVVGLTLRGFGESEAPSGVYSLDRFADDIDAALGHLGAQRAVLVGHSFGGWIVTRFAVRYPQRVVRAIYLDAAFDMRASDSVVARRPVKRPSMAALTTRADVMQWLKRNFFGVWTPALEAEYRARPADEDSRTKLLQPLLEEARRAPDGWDQLRAPVLAICALAEVSSEFPWLQPDDRDYAVARRYVETERRPFQRAECERFRQSARSARTVELSGHHYIFVLRRSEVAEAIRAFAPER